MPGDWLKGDFFGLSGCLLLWPNFASLVVVVIAAVSQATFWWTRGAIGGGLVSVIDMDGRRGSCLQPKCVLHNFKASLKQRNPLRAAILWLFFLVQIEFHSWLHMAENAEGESERFSISHPAYTCYLAFAKARNHFDQFLCNYLLPIREKLIN